MEVKIRIENCSFRKKANVSKNSFFGIIGKGHWHKGDLLLCKTDV